MAEQLFPRNITTAANLAIADSGSNFVTDEVESALAELAVALDTVEAHAANTSNPHSVTTTQIGAIPATEKGAALGVATLDASTLVPVAQVPEVQTLDFTGGALNLLRVNSAGDGLEFASPAAAPVDSVNGATGVVVLDATDVGAIPATEKAAANGVASLDSGGKVPVTQLPSTIMDYVGTWDASTNTPTLADGVGNADADIGNVYRVSTAGSQDLGSGSIAFSVGDYAILNNSKVWEKSDTTDAVDSVNGFQGTVVLDTGDISEGTNLYYTEARVTANAAVAANTAHAALVTGNPHAVNAGQIDIADAGSLITATDVEGALQELATVQSATTAQNTASVTTASLADAAQETTTITLGKIFTLLKIETDVEARVRLYHTAAAAATDAVRDEVTAPSSSLELIADVVTTTGALSVNLIPTLLGASYETTPSSDISITITNKSGGASTVTATITKLTLEQ